MAVVIEIREERWTVSNYLMGELVARIRLVSPALSGRALRLIDQSAALHLFWLDRLHERDPAEAPQIGAATSMAARSLATELAASSDERDREGAQILKAVSIAAEAFSVAHSPEIIK